jgi:hypothetical protein
MTQWQEKMIELLKAMDMEYKAVGDALAIRLFNIEANDYLYALKTEDGFHTRMDGWDDEKDIKPALEIIEKQREDHKKHGRS